MSDVASVLALVVALTALWLQFRQSRADQTARQVTLFIQEHFVSISLAANAEAPDAETSVVFVGIDCMNTGSVPVFVWQIAVLVGATRDAKSPTPYFYGVDQTHIKPGDNHRFACDTEALLDILPESGWLIGTEVLVNDGRRVTKRSDRPASWSANITRTLVKGLHQELPATHPKNTSLAEDPGLSDNLGTPA